MSHDLPPEAANFTENSALRRQIIAAGQRVGLFLDEDKMERLEQEEEKINLLLSAPVVFTLRPVDEYLSHYRGSWTRLQIAARAVDELGHDERGVGLVFEARFSLAYVEGDDPADPGLVIEEIVARLNDFVRSFPAEAAILLADPLAWEIDLGGEIIYELEQSNTPLLDFGIYPTLGLSVWLYETANETDFEAALSTLSDDAPLGRAIHDTLQRLALLLRWLDIEAPPTPPLLDMLGGDFYDT